jgi:hypothetical protein
MCRQGKTVAGSQRSSTHSAASFPSSTKSGRQRAEVREAGLVECMYRCFKSVAALQHTLGSTLHHVVCGETGGSIQQHTPSVFVWLCERGSPMPRLLLLHHPPTSEPPLHVMYVCQTHLCVVCGAQACTAHSCSCGPGQPPPPSRCPPMQSPTTPHPHVMDVCGTLTCVSCVRHRPAQHTHALAVPVKLQQGQLLQPAAVVGTHRGGVAVGVAAPLITQLL